MARIKKFIGFTIIFILLPIFCFFKLYELIFRYIAGAIDFVATKISDYFLWGE